MPLAQLIYYSRPFGFDAPTLEAILASAQRRNAQEGLTGALICRADLFVQMLEGSRTAVTAAFRRILLDDRHSDVELVWSGDAVARLFPDWTMRDDPAHSWMWSQEDVSAGAAREAGAAAYRRLFDRLASTERMLHPWRG